MDMCRASLSHTDQTGHSKTVTSPSGQLKTAGLVAAGSNVEVCNTVPQNSHRTGKKRKEMHTGFW